MFKIPIYKAEAEAGLKSVIESNASIAYCSLVKPAQVDEKNINRFLTEANKKFDLDILYPTKSVLVTSNWNRNDDVFGVKEIWAARHTPSHKPTNIEHDHKQIVGHITDTWVVDAEGNVIDDDTAIDDLPELIHICNGAVIYKHYKEDELRERALELIEQIEANEKFVSMECLFPDFDYALISEANDKYVVSRNEDTAFLTKHLRAYGGHGEFQGYKVGRYLKNMIFSGKGYVDVPANPDSIIFSDDKPNFSFSDATYKSTFNFKNGVKNNIGGASEMLSANVKSSREIVMSENNEFYQKQLDEAKSKIDALSKVNQDLQEKLANANVDQLNQKVEDLKAQLEALATEKETVQKELSDSQAAVGNLEVTLKETTESKEKLEQIVEEAKVEKTKADRISALVDAGFAKEKAEQAVEKFIDMTDEQFNEAKSLFGEMKREAEADRDNDPKMSETDEVKSNKGAEASDNLDEVLDEAEVEQEEASLSAEADELTDEMAETKASVSSYFARSLGLEQDSDQ